MALLVALGNAMLIDPHSAQAVAGDTALPVSELDEAALPGKHFLLGALGYLEAVEGAFGGDIDYAQLVKLYGAAPESAKGRYRALSR